MGRGAAEVGIAGGGVAGAVLAWRLARAGRAVVLLHRPGRAEPFFETLPPSAKPARLAAGLDDALLARAGARPCWRSWSAWGAAAPSASEHGLHPCGPWWVLDRERLRSALLERAVAAGARRIDAARIGRPERAAGGWELPVVRAPEGRRSVLRARILVDATGAAAALARSLGARRRCEDRLLCAAAIAGAFDRAADLLHGEILVEAEAGGWWTSFAHADALQVLCVAAAEDWRARVDAAGSWGALARAPAWTRRRLGAAHAPPARRFRAAPVARSTSWCGPGWLAVGDAAMSVDPLSSHGLVNAVETALLAADLITSSPDPARGTRAYDDALGARWTAHLARRRDVYAGEGRWPASAFWAARATARLHAWTCC